VFAYTHGDKSSYRVLAPLPLEAYEVSTIVNAPRNRRRVYAESPIQPRRAGQENERGSAYFTILKITPPGNTACWVAMVVVLQ